jgi:hypothetical protein
MIRATFAIIIAFLSCTAAAESPPVTFESPCSCHDNHGEHRWGVKNDPSTPPVDASAIQAVTPSDVFSWPGPAEHLTQSSARTGIENKWYALTGRVKCPTLQAQFFERAQFAYEKHWQRVRESKPISPFHKFARFRWKLAAISALTAFSENGRFARIAQNYAVRVSDFVRKQFREPFDTVNTLSTAVARA